MIPGALDGLVVVDFSRVLAGPYATMMLGDFGADVIKIERPQVGDDTREWGPPYDSEGVATYFNAVNRNKRSVVLDLTDPADQQRARELDARRPPSDDDEGQERGGDPGRDGERGQAHERGERQRRPARFEVHVHDGLPLALDTDPSFQGTIEFRPNEAAEQFVPDALPVDDSELFAPAPIEDAKAKEPRTRELPPLLKGIRSHLEGLTLTVSFTVTRRAWVALLAKRGGRTVARTPKRILAEGRHTLALHLSRDRYPTKLAFEAKGLKR